VEAEAWIREHVEPAGEPELVHERPWASVWQVPVAGGIVWFKACEAVQAFEPRLTAELATRHPSLLPDVLAYDEERAWLLLGDLGTPIHVDHITLDDYVELLPRYAELQRTEAAHAETQLAHGVPDLRPERLPDRFDALVAAELPLPDAEAKLLRDFAPRFRELCAELGAYGVPAAIQHDDLHGNNLYAHAGGTRILDWGDSSVAHPFFLFPQIFRHVDPSWQRRLRDAYLEPWGDDAACADLAIRVSWFAYAIASLRQRDHHAPADRPEFDKWFAGELREAIAEI
jgi:hypothetical protein